MLALRSLFLIGHIVPLGAHTTILQRYFLPHHFDTIASQLFGMSEDLASMALAQATPNPALASWSIMVLIVFFNLARCMLSSGRWKKVAEHAAPKSGDDGADSAPTVEGSNVIAPT